MRDVPCALCGETEHLALFHACDRLYGVAGMFRVVRCLRCGLLRTLPQPEPHELRRWYPEDRYYAYAPRRTAFARRAWRAPLLALRYFPGPLLGPILAAVAKRPPGRVLDVGCGAGEFLDLCAALGWQTVGVELSPRAVELARGAGHEAYCADFLSAPLSPGSFQLIHMSHVLEHMPDPLAALRHARELLAPDGLLIVRVPNIGSPWARAFGCDWYPLDVPRHLWHFSRDTLLAALGKASLAPVRLRTRTFCPLWSLMLRGARRRAGGLSPSVFRPPGRLRLLLWQLATAPPRLLSNLLGLGDELIALAAPEH